ncbi:MAG: bifunctional DNA primase/polymerase [Dehalococcoidia bacterium]
MQFIDGRTAWCLGAPADDRCSLPEQAATGEQVVLRDQFWTWFRRDQRAFRPSLYERDCEFLAAAPGATPAEARPARLADGEGRRRGPKRRCEVGSWAKHPQTRNGVKDASTDPGRSQVERWRLSPDANVAIGTGGDLVVLDVDVRTGGFASLDELEAKHGPLPKTVAAASGSGGRHFYFKPPAGSKVASRQGFLPGLDLKGEGGYVLAPPSRNGNGPYNWLEGQSPDDVDVAEMPPWLLQLLTARKPGSESPFANGRIVPEGERHDALMRLGGSLRHHGFDAAEINDVLGLVNERRCNPPLPECEVQDMARWLAAQPPGRPLRDYVKTARTEAANLRHMRKAAQRRHGVSAQIVGVLKVRRAATLVELCDIIDLPRSSLQRILAAMDHDGKVQCDPKCGVRGAPKRYSLVASDGRSHPPDRP